jgi:hypothetical protein
MTGLQDEPTKVLRVIAQLNVGDSAIQAITLSRLLDERLLRRPSCAGERGTNARSDPLCVGLR